MKKLFSKTRAFAILFAIVNLFFVGTASAQATLTSDSADYQPGSTCTLTGTGFQPGETVHIRVLHSSNYPTDTSGVEHEPWYVTADANGNFVTSWQVSLVHCVGKLLRATAIGQSSGENVWTEFTDPTITSTPSGGNWNNTATWVGGVIPGLSDDVVIAVGASVTVTDNRSANSVTIAAGSLDTKLQINPGIILSVASNVTINSPGSNSRTNEIIVGSGILNIGNDLNVNGGGGTGRLGRITISTGSVDVNGNITTNAAAALSLIIFSGAGTLNVGGNWSHSGAFTKSTSTVTFDGITQSISGAVAIDFNNLTITTGATLTGNISPATTATGTFTIQNGGKYIHTAANGIVPGGAGLKVFGATSTYEWKGNAAFPTAAGINFGNLIINPTGGNINSSGNLTSIQGNLIIENTPGGGSYILCGSTSPILNIGGNLIVNNGLFIFTNSTGLPEINVDGDFNLNGGTFIPSISSGVPKFFVSGDWIKNGGTFNPGNTTVTLNGITQTIGGTNPTTFYGLTILGGGTKTLTNDITVNGPLTLTSGIIDAAANNRTVTIGNSGSASTGSNASHINGKLARIYGTTVSKNFPIGKDGNWRPVSIAYTTLSGSCTITAEQIESLYPGTPPANVTAFADRYWELTQTGASGTYDITLDATGYTPASGSDPRILKFNTPSTNNSYIATILGNEYKTTGLTSFSSFALASSCPVPTINTQPSSPAAVCAGTGFPSFTVSATGPGTLTYQWQRSATGTGGSFSDITVASDGGGYTGTGLATLTVTNPPFSMNGYAYRVVVIRTCGSTVTSDGLAVLTVNNPPSISSQPGNQIITYGANATFTVTASGTGPLTYQWQEKVGAGTFIDITNGGVYSDATTATLTLTKPGVSMSSNTYRCVVTNSCGTATSDGNATLTVNAKPLTVTAVTDSKTYNATTSSLASPTVEALASGDVVNTAPTQVYDNKNVGTTHVLTASGLTINNAVAVDVTANYNITYTPSAATGVITTRAINVTAQTDTKVYDGNNSSSVSPIGDALQGTDTYTTHGTQTYNNKDVATGKTMTAAGAVINDGNSGNNYAVTYVTNATGVITTRAINVTAQTDTKVYDGNNSSSVSPIGDALQGTDTYTTHGTQTYNNKDVATGKTMTAAGAVINDGNSGNNYAVTYVTNATGVITTRAINVTAQTDTKVYDGNNSSSVSPIGDALQGTDTYTTHGTQTYNNKDVATGKTMTAAGAVINDGNSGNNYAVTYVTNATGVITTRAINVTAQTDTKVYDGNNSSSVSPIGDALQGTDTYTTHGTQTYNNKDVATGKTMTAAGAVINDGNSGNNYAVTYVTNATGVITTRAINVTAQTDTKVYDGNNSSSVSPIGDALQGTDTYTTHGTQTYNNKDVATGKTMTAAGAVINDGNSGNNYAVTYVTNATGVITTRAINVTAQTDTKVYDGNNSSSVSPIGDALQGTDTYTTHGTQTYNNKDVATGKTMTAAGAVINDGNSGNNYAVTYVTNATGVITTRAINVTAQTDTKVYDGNNSSSVSPIGDALQGTDTYTTHGTQTYNNKDVATGKTMTAAGAVINDGNSGNNYAVTYVTNATGVITTRAINVTAQTDTKVYDGNNSSSVSPIGDALQGTDTYTTHGTQTYNNKDVATGKTMTAAGAVINDGNSGNNYAVTYVTNATGVITTRAINVTAQTDTKVYDGNNSSSVSPIGDALQGTDTYTTHGTQTYNNKDVATGKTMTAAGAVINDGNSGNNYAVTYVTNATGVITTRAINVTAQTDTKVYDGNNSSSVSPIGDALQGTDTYTTHGTQTYNNKDVATGKTMTAAGAVINDGNSGNNYAVTYVTNATGVITTRAINVTAQTDTKVYDGNNSSSVSPIGDALQGTDTYTTHGTQTYNNKDVATGKTMTAAGAVINDGNSGNNYAVTYVTNATGVITTRAINVTAQTDTKVYDGNNSSSVSPIGDALQGTDTYTTHGTQTYNNKDVATGKTMTAAGAVINDGNSGNNYAVTYVTNATGVITTRAINVTAQTDTKVYDGNNSSSVSPIGDALQGTDTYTTHGTQTYNNKDVATGKTMTAAGAVINDGNSGNNYAVTYVTNATGVITTRAINVTAQTDTKVYDGNNSSSVSPIGDALQGTDTYTTHGTQTYNNKDVATGKTMTAAGAVINDGNSGNNYAVTYVTNATGVITTRAINVTAQTDTKVYDGNNSSSVSPIGDALQGTDTYTTHGTQTYNNKDVATGKTMTAAGAVINDGNSGNNYAVTYVTNATGVITTRAINVTAQTDTKVYDGNNSSSVSPIGDALQGTDTYTTHGTQTYNNKDVATGKTMTAAGAVINDGNSGNNYAVTYVTNATGVITTRAINVTAQTDTKVYDGNNSSSVSPIGDALQGTDTYTTHGTQTYNNKDVATGKTMTAAGAVINDGNSGNNYAVTYVTNATGVITTRAINVTAQTDTKVYDGNNSSSVSPIGDALQGTDTYTTHGTQTYNNKDVATGKTMTAAGAVINDGNSGNNYAVTYVTNATGVITTRAINVTAQTDTKVYDGNNSSSVSPIGDALQGTDTYTTHGTQTYNNKDVATGKTMTAAGAVINDGNSGNNYAVTYVTNATGVITTRAINVTAQTDTKVYDGNNSSSVSPIGDALQGTDTYTTHGTQTYNNKDVATGKTMTAAGAVINDGNSGNNYAVTYVTNATGVITTRAINVTAQTDTKVYDGNNSSSVSPIGDALQGTDTYTTHGTQTYNNKDVATGKTMTAAGAVINDGNSGNNYAVTYVTNATGVITTRAINVTAQTDTKVYDGNNSSSVSPIGDALQGTDTYTTHGTQTYNNKDVATGKTMTAAGAVINDGNSGNNYAVTYVTNATGVITTRAINVTAQTDTKVYDGNNSSSVSPIGDALQGTDTYTTHGTQTYNNKDVATGKTMTAAGAVINDGNSGNNYAVTYVTNATGVITTRAINVTAQTDTKVYDGNNSSSVSPIGDALQGTDTYTTHGTQTYNNKDVATGKTMTAAGAVINDGNSGNNYAVTYVTNATGVITTRAINVTAQTDTKVYDGNNSSSVSPIGDALQGTDTYTTHGTQTYNNKDVATGKTMTAAGAVINDGNSGNNYAVTYVTNATGVITTRAINVTAQTDTKVYDGNNSSSVSPIGDALQGTDTYTTHGTQTYNNKDVATGKTMTAAGAVINDGNSGNNYAVTYVTNATGVITTRAINVTAQTDTKVYDGNNSSSVSPIGDALQGTDTYTTHGTQTYNNKDVATGKTMTAAGAVINDGNSGNNYAVTYVTNATGVITTRAINVTAQTDTKVYDGNNSSSVSPIGDALQGTDTYTTHGTQTYNNKDVATGKTMTAAGAVINDGNSGNNYAVTYVTNATGVITTRAINVTAQTDTKVYDGNNSSSVSPIGDALQGTDTYTTHGTQTYNNKDVATGKTMTAAGAVINDGNSGNNYAVTYVTNATGVITTRAINVTAQTDTKVYDGNNSSSVSPIGDALQGTDTYTTHGTQTYNNKDVATGKTMTAAGAVINDGNSGNNYAVTYVTNATGVITTRAINVTAQTDTKVYDGNNSSSVSPIGDALQGTDTYTTHGTQTYNNKDVATGKTMTAAGAVINDGNSGNNYAVTYVTNATGVITTRAINVTAQTDTKVYDGNNSSSVSPIGDALQGTDTYTTHGTQTYNNKDVATGKTMTAAGAVINDGNSGNNYAVTYVTNATGVITTRAINVTAQTDTKVYDGNNSSSVSPIGDALQGTDTYTTHGTQTYNNKDVATGKTMTAAGAVINDGNSGNNYAVTYVTNATGVITTRAINVTAQTDTKVYDGNNSSSVSPIGDALQGTDTYTTHGTQTYNNKDVATGKTMTAAGAVINDGNSGNNYAVTYVTNATGVITTRAINVTAQTDTKVYDGNNSSSVSPIGDALQGTDTYTTHGTQTYNNKDVATGKTMTAAGAVINDGNSGNNYAVTYVTNATGVITTRAINVTAQTDTKVYDGNNSSSVSPIGDALQGTDTYTTHGTQTYNNKDVATGKTMTAAGAVINDGNSGNNYAVTYVTNSTGVITQKSITAALIGSITKMYDATNVATLVAGNYSLPGIIGTDVVVLNNPASGTYNNKNVGTGKNVAVTGLSISGADAGNYSLTSTTANANIGIISVRPINVNAQTDSRIYNGTTGSSVSPIGDVLQGSDTYTTHGSQTYNTKHVATGKVMIATGAIINDGNAGLNYSITYVTNNTGVISVKAINVTAHTDTRLYNGTTSSSVAPTVDALEPNDVIGTAPVQNYDTRNVGTGMTLTASGLVINDGNSGNNYSVTYIDNITGEIIVRPISVTAIANTKIYDGNISALAAPTYPALQVGDVVGTAPTEVYDNPLVGTGKTLTASGLVINDGNSGNNYSISYVVNTNGIINLASTTTTLITSAASVRFMDLLTMTAQITPLNTATALTGTVEFKIGTVSYGSAIVVPIPGDPNGSVQATIIPQVTNLPASYTVTAIFTSTNTNYSGSSNTKPLTVVARTASPYVAMGFYTGDTYAWTTGPNSSTATLTMVAAIKDANSPTGDVRGARVSFYFVNGTTYTPISSAQNLPVGLIDINDGSVGTASAIVQLNIGSSNAESFQIAIKVTGAYTNNFGSTLSQTIVTVSKPVTGGYIVGGSQIRNINSSGYIKGHTGLNTDFQFDIKYNNSGTNPKGKATVMIRSYYKPNGVLDSVLHLYLIKTNAIALLNISNPLATGTFSAKANMVEQLADLTTVSLESGATFQMKVFQNGCNQQIAITYHRRAGGIWFSSNWNATSASTALQAICAGSNVYVAGGGTCSASNSFANTAPLVNNTAPIKDPITAPIEQTFEITQFNVLAYPNPSPSGFSLILKGGSNEKVQVIVRDVSGKPIKTIETNDIKQQIRFGADLRPGIYMAEIIQGKNRKTVKLIKQ